MNRWIPTGLGAEPKKVMVLIGLLVLAGVGYYLSSNSGGGPASTPAPRSLPATDSVVVAPRPVTRPVNRQAATNRDAGDFRPSLKLPEDFDLTKVDPTLQTDLLTKVRGVGDVGGVRSLFEFYTPPPPPIKVDPIKVAAPKPDAAATKPTGPVKPAGPPPPPPIPLKYYGYEGVPRSGNKLRALFVDGEDTFVVGENEMIRNRYRVIRIGITTAEVEDTVAKNTQPLRIVERQDQ